MSITSKLREFHDANKWLSPDAAKKLASIIGEYTIEIPEVSGKRLKVGDSVMGKSDNKIWYVIGFKPGRHSIVCQDNDKGVKDLKPEWVELIPKFVDRNTQPLFVGKKVWYLDQTLKNDIGECKEIPIWVPVEIAKITKARSLGMWFIETKDKRMYEYNPNKFMSRPYCYSPQQIDTLVNMSSDEYSSRILHTRMSDVKPGDDLTEKKYQHILSLIDNGR